MLTLLGSGTIDFEEFCLMMYRQMQAEEEAKIPERDEKELSEAFRLFDLNGDGFIEWDELKVICTLVKSITLLKSLIL